MAQYRGGSQPPHMWRGTGGRDPSSGSSRPGGGGGGAMSPTVVIVVLVVLALIALSLYLGAGR